MKGVKITRTDLRCEHGPVAECYSSGRCVACAKQKSRIQWAGLSPQERKQRYRHRCRERKRQYNRLWRSKNPEYQANYHIYDRPNYYARKCEERDPNWRPRWLRTKIQKECRDLRDIASLVRSSLAKPKRQARTRLQRTLDRLWRQKCSRLGANFSKADLARLLEAAIARGEVCEDTIPYSVQPENASVDQIIAGLGYGLENIRIVPLWLNLAKNQWDWEEVENAVRRWCIAK